MKQKFATYSNKILASRNFLIRHRVVVFLIISASIYGFMLHRINVLANIEPEQTVLDAKLQEVKRVKINEASIKQIQELEARNINLEALFDNGRENPFQE